MSILSRLFGGRGRAEGPKEEPAEEYKGFRIVAQPAPAGSQFRIGARIEKDLGGETKVHELVRADTLESRDAAVSASVAKAKQMIDEQGERMFA